MVDYKTMYYKLFNAITDAVEILQSAQIETEEMYMDTPETIPVNLKLVEKTGDNKKQK